MWICLNNAFLSIVAPKNPDLATTHLLVRARRPGDVEAVFPGFTATTIDGRDYQFRADIPREIVAHAIATSLAGIKYTNFKDSVRNRVLHDAYLDFWHVMAKVQPQRPYARYSMAKAPARKPVPAFQG